MKKILMTITLLLMGKMSFSASSGLLFNVSVNGKTFIFTPKANNAYSDIGMLITSPNYSFSTPTTQCSGWPSTNGYCKFSASPTSPASVSINGPFGVINFQLCLNLSGKLTCQNYNKELIKGTITSAVNNNCCNNSSTVTFNGNNLNYLGPDGSAYEWMQFGYNGILNCSNGEPVTTNYSVGATNTISAISITFGPTSAADYMDPGERVAICPAGTTSYDETVCTNCLYHP